MHQSIGEEQGFERWSMFDHNFSHCECFV